MFDFYFPILTLKDPKKTCRTEDLEVVVVEWEVVILEVVGVVLEAVILEVEDLWVADAPVDCT